MSFSFSHYNFSINKILILLSFIGTVSLYLYPEILKLGLHDIYLQEGNYILFIVQIFISNFLHGGMLHFLFNSVFLYYFGTILEGFMGRKKYLLFFLFTSIFNGVCIINFENTGVSTIGISGFAMALLSYYTLELKARKNPEWKGGITAIMVNVGIGLLPGISIWGHIFGAVSGIIFYLLNRDWFQRKMVGA